VRHPLGTKLQKIIFGEASSERIGQRMGSDRTLKKGALTLLSKKEGLSIVHSGGASLQKKRQSWRYAYW